MSRLTIVVLAGVIVFVVAAWSRAGMAGGQDRPAQHGTAKQAAHAMGGHHGAHAHDAPDPHMKMTPPRPQTDADRRRADAIVATLRRAIEPYRDADRAQADRYRPFLAHLELPEYHFTNWARGFIGAFTFDPARPMSLLYAKRDGRYELRGAMYTAPARATEADLDARVPLGVGQWHAHVNICLPLPRDRPGADWTRFGFRGSIVTREACDAAGDLGTFRRGAEA
jgi:hypothetical protein